MLSVKYSVSNIFLVVLFTLYILVGAPVIPISADEAVKEQKSPYSKEEIAIKIIP